MKTDYETESNKLWAVLIDQMLDMFCPKKTEENSDYEPRETHKQGHD